MKSVAECDSMINSKTKEIATLQAKIATLQTDLDYLSKAREEAVQFDEKYMNALLNITTTKEGDYLATDDLTTPQIRELLTLVREQKNNGKIEKPVSFQHTIPWINKVTGKALAKKHFVVCSDPSLTFDKNDYVTFRISLDGITALKAASIRTQK